MHAVTTRMMSARSRVPAPTSVRPRRSASRQAWAPGRLPAKQEEEDDDDNDSLDSLPIVRPHSATSKISDDASSRHHWNKLKEKTPTMRPGSTRSVRSHGSSVMRSGTTRGHLLAPPRPAPSSRRGSLYDGSSNNTRDQSASSRGRWTTGHRDDADSTTAENPASMRAPGQPRTAWELFEDHIMAIDDSAPCFNRHSNHFSSSETFKHTLAEIDYTPTPPLVAPANSRRSSDVDFDTVSKVNFRINDDDTYFGDVTSQYGDELTIGTSGRSISPVSTAVDDDAITIGEDRSRSAVGTIARATPHGFSIDEDPLNEEPLHEQDDERDDEDKVDTARVQLHRAHTDFVPAADLAPDTETIRQELYQRYLDKPDTWAKGLKKYLVRTVIRERVTAGTNYPHSAPIGFRPKSISASEVNLVYPSLDHRGGVTSWGAKQGRSRLNSASTTIAEHRANNTAGPKAKSRRRAATAIGSPAVRYH